MKNARRRLVHGAGALGEPMEFIVNIDVDDLEAGRQFYAAALGLRVGRRLGDDGLELIGASSAIYLLRKPAGTAAVPRGSALRRYERHWTPVHLDFVVAHIDAAVERALDAGAVLEQPVSDHAWGRLALMADPFGHGFCLIEFSGRGYDEIADRGTDATSGQVSRG